nr:(-)-alpha-terpineol synthase-like [Ipomoea batatas]
MHAYFCITNPINKEDPQHLNNPGIIHSSAMILRLVNDWRTSRDEMLKGDIVKLSQHYMRESGCSKRKLGSTSIATAEMWKKLSIELVMMERCTPYWLSYPTSPPQIQRESIIYLVKDSKYHKTAKLYLNCLGTETKRCPLTLELVTDPVTLTMLAYRELDGPGGRPILQTGAKDRDLQASTRLRSKESPWRSPTNSGGNSFFFKPRRDEKIRGMRRSSERDRDPRVRSSAQEIAGALGFAMPLQQRIVPATIFP